MTEAFRAHLEHSGLISPGARVLVGVSGGADSLCLLHLLHACGVDVVAGYLDHQQRPEAADEADMVREFAALRGIPFVAGRADVPQMTRDLGMSLEEAGRHARYAFFRTASRQAECDLIATAHHLDDHVETVLFNLARGTGLAGLAGIPERRENIVRPLLPFSRAEIAAFVQEQGWTVVHDPSNEDLSFSRARIRHRVMPELEAINGEFREAVARLSQIADSENGFLDGMAAAGLETAEIRLNGELWWLAKDCEVCFDRAALRRLPRVLLVRAIRLVAGILGARLDSLQTETIADGLASEPKGSASSDRGAVHVSWDEGRVYFSQSQPVEPFRFPLTLPGDTDSDEFGWTFAADYVMGSDWSGTDRFEGRLDADRAAGGLHLRGSQTGDQIVPVGFAGTKKLADVLRDMGLTKAARSRMPIICDMSGPIWVPGGPVAERVKVTSDTKRQIRIRFGPVNGSAEGAHGP
jgi:tRNA(Ile)-lysidine synthase